MRMAFCGDQKTCNVHERCFFFIDFVFHGGFTPSAANKKRQLKNTPTTTFHGGLVAVVANCAASNGF